MSFETSPLRKVSFSGLGLFCFPRLLGEIANAVKRESRVNESSCTHHCVSAIINMVTYLPPIYHHTENFYLFALWYWDLN
jgi:hypothetical protein